MKKKPSNPPASKASTSSGGNELEALQHRLLRRKPFALLAFAVVCVVAVADLTDALSKLSAFFGLSRQDTVAVDTDCRYLVVDAIVPPSGLYSLNQ